MAAPSSAPAVKAALLTLLQADSGLTGVQLTYNHPGLSIQQEAAYFQRTIQTEELYSAGQRHQHETYDVELVVDVSQDGDDAQVCEERCWAIVARVELVIRANNGSGGGLSTAFPAGVGGAVTMGGVTMTPYINTGARLAEAVCLVHVEAIK